jgi:AhpD family alkylhydroperoxidase
MSHVRIAYETFQKTAPGAQAALLAMGKSTEESGLDKTIVELAKLRVSQINNCAFCLQIHLNVSRKLGIAGSSTWWRTGPGRHLFERECAARWAKSADASGQPRRSRTRPTTPAASISAKANSCSEHRHRHHQSPVGWSRRFNRRSQ